MKKNNQKNGQYYVGRQIRASEVLLVDEENNNCGQIKIQDALAKAESAGLDLVQIARNGKIPTCKILDYSKFKYEASKKEKLARKKQRESTSKIKEIKFRPSTNFNDLKIKANKANKFLDNGDKLKITITFKGRELSHKDVAKETLDKFMSYLISDIEVISDMTMTGKNLSVMVSRKIA